MYVCVLRSIPYALKRLNTGLCLFFATPPLQKIVGVGGGYHPPEVASFCVLVALRFPSEKHPPPQ